MRNMDRKEVELKDKDSIEFVNTTKTYGRAEFSVCQKYRRGKLVELYIYPEQQQSDKYYVWRAVGGGARDFMLGVFHGLDNPKVWMFGYCREHKTVTFRMYVPADSRFLRFEVLSGISLYFTKTRVR